MALPLDKDVTIKQCVRRPTISPFTRTENPLALSKKNSVPPPSGNEMRSRFASARSISLASHLIVPNNHPRLSRTFSLNHGVSPSNVQVRIDSEFPSDLSDSEIEDDNDIVIRNMRTEEESVTVPRAQSAAVRNTNAAKIIQVRPWTACSDPPQLLNPKYDHFV